MKARVIWTLCVATACLLVASPATATQVPLRWVGMGPYMGTDIFNGAGKTYTNVAGIMNILVKCDGVNPSPLRVFCVEIAERVSADCTLYNLLDPLDGTQIPIHDGWLEFGPPMGQPKADLLCKLWASVIGPTYCDFVRYAPTDAQAAAMSLAIWEVIFETTGNPLNLSAGWFQAGNLTYKALAQSYLDGLANYNGPSAALIGLQNDDHQDYITIVPEPVTLLGGVLGLGLLGGYLRRRRTA